jgi:SAM-dependent methyltransferase
MLFNYLCATVIILLKIDTRACRAPLSINFLQHSAISLAPSKFHCTQKRDFHYFCAQAISTISSILMNNLLWGALLCLWGMVLLQSCEGCGMGVASRQLSEQERKELEQHKSATHDSSERELWQKPQLLIDLMGDLSDKTVADIGAGMGYFTFRLADRAKKVIAVDIDPASIQYIEEEKLNDPESLRNRIETRLAAPDDTRLNPHEADVLLIVNTYIYLDKRVDYLKRLRRTLKPGGTIYIVDYKKKNLNSNSLSIPPINLRMAANEVEAELLEAGFTDIYTDDQMLDYQYITSAKSL